MSIEGQLIEEIRNKEKYEKDTRKKLVLTEQAIFKDLIDIDAKCSRCGRREYLTLDHIVPKVILQTFGVDTDRKSVEGNYQLLCKTCNSFKSGRLDFSIPITKTILLKLLEKL